MARRRTARDQVYRLARDLGNVEAIRKGPSAYSKRVVRRATYRTVNRQLGRSLRRVGL